MDVEKLSNFVNTDEITDFWGYLQTVSCKAMQLVFYFPLKELHQKLSSSNQN